MTLAATQEERLPMTPNLAALQQDYGHLSGIDLMRVMVQDVFPGRIALVSSFGSESAVLLDMLAQVDPTVPILFLDTGKLFGETLRYRDRIQERFGLTDIRSLEPGEDDLKAEDHNGLLWTRDTDACCDLRKTRPLNRAIKDFDAWFTGRKRFQTPERAALPVIEQQGSRFKINPLANFELPDLQRIATERDLPRHPLVSDGYLSIGCMPCTRRVQEGEDYRAGRWADSDKTECGIHLGEGI